MTYRRDVGRASLLVRWVACVAACLLSGCSTDRTSKAPATDQAQAVEATVAAYETNAEWDHFEDGSFASYDHMTLQIDAPKQAEVKTLVVAVTASQLADDSAFRTPGTRIRFTLDDPIPRDGRLYWGALNHPIIVE